jgi:hypothetical protein
MGLVNYGRSADIWSLGCILGEMAGGQAMFPACSTTQACRSIFGFFGTPPNSELLFWQRLPLWSSLCNNIRGVVIEKGFPRHVQDRLGVDGLELLSSMLSCHPDHRPSAAMVRSHHFRFGWDAAHCQDRLDEDGYVVVKGIFPEPMISAAVAAIRDRVLLLLRLYDLMPANAVGVFEALLSAIPLLHRAPPGWPGLPFGALGKRGWVKPVGSGRMFDDFIQRPQYHEHPGVVPPPCRSRKRKRRFIAQVGSGAMFSESWQLPGIGATFGPASTRRLASCYRIELHSIPSVAKVA